MSKSLEWTNFASLPQNWNVAPVKRFGEVTLGKMLQSSPREETDSQRPYLRAANVQADGRLSLEDSKQMWFSSTETRSLTLSLGDVVVVEGGMGGYARAAFVSDDQLDGWGFQNSINRIRPRHNNDGRYLAYALQTVRATGFIETYCNVVSMPHFTADKLSKLAIPYPPLDEQRAIADYLDHETVQIDTLVAKQEEFIGLLREQRASMIAHELPDRSTKTVPLRRAVDAIDCAHVTAEFVDDTNDFPWRALASAKDTMLT